MLNIKIIEDILRTLFTIKTLTQRNVNCLYKNYHAPCLYKNVELALLQQLSQHYTFCLL